MNHNDMIDLEIRNLAISLSRAGAYSNLGDLALMIKCQIVIDNDMRKKPYRIGHMRVSRIIHQMLNSGELATKPCTAIRFEPMPKKSV